MSALQDAKLVVMGITDLEKDALHIHVGLAVFFVSGMVFRWPLRGGRPWLAALAVAAIGEAWDILDTARGGAPQIFAANWHDMWNTMLWPTLITAMAIWTQVLSRR